MLKVLNVCVLSLESAFLGAYIYAKRIEERLIALAWQHSRYTGIDLLNEMLYASISVFFDMFCITVVLKQTDR